MAFDPKMLSLYPEDPGVYLMKDKAGKILYIGKAKKLRSRIKQYFVPQRDSREMVPYLTAQIETIETIIALTEKDALLLEDQLIKKHQPKYNILLKDDKSFIYLMITQHKWPMIRLVRFKGNPKEKGSYFGPFASASLARHLYDLLCQIFPLRQCSDAELRIRTRPCLLYDIKRCIAPCVDKCSQEEYAKHLEGAVRLLKGQNRELIQELKKRMQAASDALEFEKAGKCFEMIQTLEKSSEKQHVRSSTIGDSDVLGFYREADAIVIALLIYRNGLLVSSKHFSFHFIASKDEETIETFLMQYYKNQIDKVKTILVPIPLEGKTSLEQILQASIQYPKRREKKQLVEMANKNAKALFFREQDLRSLREKMLLDLQETLKLTRFPKVIECFDSSNIARGDPVASMVCFVDGEKDKSKMRNFKIKTIEKADDYTAMKEVLFRHYKKQKEQQTLPDLLIVDGGKGQLNIALNVFEELKIASVDIIALTKEEGRHDKGLSKEKIYVPYRKDPFLIEPRSPLLFLLQRVRDEAHNKAVSFHRKRRSKRILQSEIDEIPGIGPTKKKRLLQTFQSVERLKKAHAEEIQRVKGITKKDVQNILTWQKRRAERPL